MDGINLQMDAGEMQRLAAQNRSYNVGLDGARVAKNELGKDDFLRILITQLTNQDPTAPMEDREFIAQMAQFSTLEQMTNLASQFERLSGLLLSGQAVSLLGRYVEVLAGEQLVSGQVEEVTGGTYPQVLVNGIYYDYASVQSVRAHQR